MNLKANTYHKDLIKDKKRVSAFKNTIETIKTKENNLAIDIGCGSGILSIFASKKYKKVIGIEINPNILKYTKENIKPYPNIELIKTNAKTYTYTNLKPDLIICEMLDTGLIDEEQIPVLNQIPENIKKHAKIIPYGIINKIEAINMENNTITYEDNTIKPKHTIISEKQTYDELNFKNNTNPNFKKTITLKITENSKLNGIKITTETLLTKNKLLKPTPMLNPKLLIPLNKEIPVKKEDKIKIELSYIMGEGLETIKTKIQ